MYKLLNKSAFKTWIFQAFLNVVMIEFLSVGCYPDCQAQDLAPIRDSAVYPTSTINWVKQYPPVAGQTSERTTKDKIVDFIMGKKEKVVLSKPVAIMATNPEDFWILDQGNGVLFKIRNELGEMPHIRNNKFKTFNSLVGICAFGENKLLFTDSYLNKIFVFTEGDKVLKTLNDTLELDQPTGIAYSPLNHQIWVIETKSHRIAILDENGRLIKRIGSRGTAPGEFNFPTSIWLDKTGKAFIVDALNFRIQIFSKDGEFISIFGKAGDATGYFARPKGIATDSFGNIYVADALFNAVQIFDQTGNFLFTFGVQGREKGEFWMPAGVYIDDKDFIYVADCYNFRVQVFQRVNGGIK